MQALESTYAGIFPGEPEAIREVRRRVREFLDGCPAADDLVLIASELATNAAVHSASRDGTFAVRIKRYDTCVYLEVRDGGGPWIPALDDGRPHGLDLVRALARQWGITGGGEDPGQMTLPGMENPGNSPGRIVWATVNF